MKRHPTIMVIATVGLLAAGGLAADDGRIEIGPTDTFPIVIDEPGSYILTTDIEVVEEDVNAIEIRGWGQITLDLGGHVIQGPCSCHLAIPRDVLHTCSTRTL